MAMPDGAHPPAASAPAVMRAEAITLRFGGVTALSGVSMEIRESDVVSRVRDIAMGLAAVGVKRELDPDEDELTRTRKLRRKYLEQKYASFIEAIYGGDTQVTAEIPVKYQDGRVGRLNAVVHVVDVEPAGPAPAAAPGASLQMSAAHG